MLPGQRVHWESVYAENPRKFGPVASEAAQLAAAAFREHRVQRILELGCGPGRDTTYFAILGFHVTALDYAEPATASVLTRAAATGLSGYVSAASHDLRQPLPFAAGTFDACYSHMTLCMGMRASELFALHTEIRRILKPTGLHVYTVRGTDDPDYDQGELVKEDLVEIDGYVLRFFDLAMVEQLAGRNRIVQVRRLDESGKRLWWVAETR